jgi:hypothetical protein
MDSCSGQGGNHIFALSRTDGLVIGNVGGVVANAVLGEQGVNTTSIKCLSVGSPYSATHYVRLPARRPG